MASSDLHNWQLYEARCREAELERLRSLTPTEKLVLYEDLYLLGSVAPVSPATRERVEMERWKEKLAIRQRMCAIFAKADQLNSEQSTPPNPA